MNSLNVSDARVDVTSDGLYKSKKDNDRFPVSVKSTLLQEIEGHLQCEPPQHILLLKRCFEINTSTEQVNVIKQIGSSLQKGCIIPSHDADLCIKVLVEIYFRAASRHMAKRAIASTFQSLPIQFHSKSVEHLKRALHEDVLFAKGSQNAELLRHIVDNIMLCLESFNLGAQCIAESTSVVLQFLHVALQAFSKHLENASCPTFAAKASLNCQATVRTLIAILQRCPSLKPPFQNYHQLIQVLELLFDIVILLMTNEENALDCRCNCARAFALFLHLHNNSQYIQMIALLVFSSSHSMVVTNKCPALSESSLNALKTCNHVSKLCLAIGLLSSLATSELLLEVDAGMSLFFDVLLTNIMSLTKQMKDSSLTIVTSRAILMWTKRAKEALEEMPNDPVLTAKLKGDGDIACQLLQYVWTHWEHFIDNVRHVTKDIFDNIISLHLLSSKEAPAEDQFISWLVQSMLVMPSHQRGKYNALCCLAHHVGAKQLLKLHPTLPEDLLKAMDDQLLFPHVSELMETLLTLHKSEIHSDLKEWEKMWVLPVMNKISQNSNSVVVENLLSKLLKCSPQSFNFIIFEIVAAGARQTVGHLRALLLTAKIARSLNLTYQSWSSTETLWNDLLPFDLLKLTLCHVDDEIRLGAFALLCDTPKTSEIFTPCTLNLISEFLPCNMSNQSPAFRQELVALVKKLIFRINEGGRSMVRQINNLKKRDPNSEDAALLQTQLQSYKDFIQQLFNSQTESLHSGANFPRRGLALNIIKLLHEIIGFTHKDDPFGLNAYLTLPHVQTLLECLKDTYETNKGIALQILTDLSTEQLGFQDPDRVLQLFEGARQLASRSRPTDCVTAAYLFRLLCHHPYTQIVANQIRRTLQDCSSSFEDYKPHELNDFSSDGSVITHSDITYSVLKVLILQLLVELEMAQGNVLEASANGPMYGVLFCIRSLLLDLNLRTISQKEWWKSLMGMLIKICLDIRDVVGPIVNNASPEGYIPVAHDSEIVEKLSKQIQETFGLGIRGAVHSTEDDCSDAKEMSTTHTSGSSRTKCVTAQMLLLCGWRTIKEISLLLGDICQRSIEIMTNSEDLSFAASKKVTHLISEEDILNIGGYFISLLAETKHRGAFEQAYVGFCKLCDALWRSSVVELNQLPQQWLQDLFLLIHNGSESSKLCSTRRSAGLPFMVQALVSSEPDVKRSRCFKEAMCTLLEMALSYDSTEDVKVHGFNILRALYRDTRFGEDVTPFIASGVKAAILGFKGRIWRVRNSATLLLSALITRIFGVKRGQDELSKKNCMTAAVFFQRFPSLYQFLLEELHLGTVTCGNSLKQTIIQPCLYAILLVLARLYPSHVEGTQTSIKLSSFIPYVLMCGQRPVMKTRILAAKALVPLVPISDVPTVIKDLFHQLPSSLEDTILFSQNAIHGSLLQVCNLLGSIAASDCEKNILRNEFAAMICKKLWISSRCNPCLVTRAAFLDVVDSALTSGILTSRNPVCKELQKNVDQESTAQSHSHIPGNDIFQVAAAKLSMHFHVNFCVMDSEEDSLVTMVHHKSLLHRESDVIRLLTNCTYEVRWVILRLLYDALCFENPNCYKSCSEDLVGINPLMEPTIPTPECKFLNEKNYRLVAKIMNSDEVAEVILLMATSTECHSDCLAQVCHLITLVPAILERPWPVSYGNGVLKSSAEKLDFVLQKGECEPRDDVRSALLHLTGFLIPYLYLDLQKAKQSKSLPCVMNQSPSVSLQSVLMEWTEAFLLCCSPEQSLRIRLTATHLLVQNAYILLLDPQKCLGSSCLSVWSSAVLLLQDDEPFIKKLASKIVETCLQEKSPNALKHLSFDATVHPALALDILIGQFVNYFGKQNPSECLTAMLDWILRQNPQDTVRFLDEERMFDRGQMNIYAEEIQFTKLVIKHFKTLLRHIFHVKDIAINQHSNLKRKDIRKQVVATLKRPNSIGISPSLSNSYTLDLNTFQALSTNFKGILDSFEVVTGKVSTLLSETQRDNLDLNSGHIYLQDVTDMIIEELFLVIQDMESICHHTPFLSLNFEPNIIRLYRLTTVVYCLCKYDCTQRNTLLRLQSILDAKFNHVHYCNNLLVTSILADIHTLCIYHNNLKV